MEPVCLKLCGLDVLQREGVLDLVLRYKAAITSRRRQKTRAGECANAESAVAPSAWPLPADWKATATSMFETV